MINLKKKFALLLGGMMIVMSNPVGALAKDINTNTQTKVHEDVSGITNDEIHKKIAKLFEDKQTDTLTFTVNGEKSKKYGLNGKGDPSTLTYYKSGLLTCRNSNTGVVYSCYPDSAYVGDGYSNGSGAVGCIQGLLNAAIIATLDVDGIYGPRTHSAIVNFQSRNSNVLSVDGIAGPRTFNWAIFLVFGKTTGI